MSWCSASKRWGCPLKPRSPERARRRGYVSLLGMAYALGLATLAGTLTAGFINYVWVARAAEARLMADIRLESAVAEVLGRLAYGVDVSDLNLDDGEATVLIESPLAKLDPAMDSAAGIEPELEGLLGRKVPAGKLASQPGLLEASRTLRLDAREEDCFRRHVTFGRAPAERYPELELQSLNAGEQLDLRVSYRSGDRDEVLWVRARLTGDDRGWQLHDYRRLSGAATCRD